MPFIGSCPHILFKSINWSFLKCIIIEPKEAARFGYSEFLLALFDLVLSTQSENEIRYIQYAAGENYKVSDNYCTTVVWYGTSYSK